MPQQETRLALKGKTEAELWAILEDQMEKAAVTKELIDICIGSTNTKMLREHIH